MATAQPLNQQQQVRLPISILLDLTGPALDIFIRRFATIAHFVIELKYHEIPNVFNQTFVEFASTRSSRGETLEGEAVHCYLPISPTTAIRIGVDLWEIKIGGQC